jgi:hypothetical protein
VNNQIRVRYRFDDSDLEIPTKQTLVPAEGD